MNAARPGVSRRAVLAGLASAGLLAACGDDPEPESFQLPQGSGRVEFLVPAFPDGFAAPSMLAAGREQRAAFVVRDDVDVLRELAPATLGLTVSVDGEVVVSQQLQRRTEGIITPYYPLVFTPEEPGQYVAEVEGADPVPFLVVDQAEVPLVQIGDPMRPVDTPTVDDALGVDPICTRAVPCPFHSVSLGEALEQGRPTVLLVSTPGFCQTDICGPVVDLLIDAVGDRTDLAAVHAEVYVDPSEFSEGGFPATTDTVNTYALPFEPHLVVADGSGTVVARLDITWDQGELRDALDQL